MDQIDLITKISLWPVIPLPWNYLAVGIVDCLSSVLSCDVVVIANRVSFHGFSAAVVICCIPISFPVLSGHAY